MATDVKLDQGSDGSFLVLEGRVVKVIGSDFMLDSPARHTGSTPFRRALVHTSGDGLAMNFGGDYPGGVTIDGIAELIPQRPPSLPPGFVANLVIRGGITYETQGVTAGGTTTIT